jgi:hypothetical protein
LRALEERKTDKIRKSVGEMVSAIRNTGVEPLGTQKNSKNNR